LRLEWWPKLSKPIVCSRASVARAKYAFVTAATMGSDIVDRAAGRLPGATACGEQAGVTRARFVAGACMRLASRDIARASTTK
jgi:hypothetical protein